jgi:translation initiation factor IF-3
LGTLRRSRIVSGRIPKRQDRINREIRENEVRLIDESGDHVGVVAIGDALRRAEEAGLDLVEVSSNSRPYVCRIMDYGNYKYERAKKQKEAKKKQHQSEVKEIKFRPRISEHDYQFKMRHSKKFILDGDKVKFVVMFRGRERSHTEFGFELLDRVVKDLEEIANVEAKPQSEGRNLIMVVAPDPAGVQTEKARLAREAKSDVEEDLEDLIDEDEESFEAEELEEETAEDISD